MSCILKSADNLLKLHGCVVKAEPHLLIEVSLATKKDTRLEPLVARQLFLPPRLSIGIITAC